MYSNQQKDVLIADLNRQIHEVKQRISPHLIQLRNLLKDSQKTIEQLQNNFYRSDQQQIQRNQQNQHLLESLSNEGQLINSNIYEIEKKIIIFRDEKQNLEYKAQDMIEQIKVQSELYSEQFEEWKIIVEEIESLKHKLQNEMYLKQKSIEEYEDQNDQYQKLKSSIFEQEKTHTTLLEKLENINEMLKEQEMTINDQSWIAQRIDKEEEINQGQEYCLIEDIEKARIIIDKLKLESDEITNITVQYQVAIDRENENIYQIQAKVEHLQGLEKIKTQHINELNLQFGSLVQQNNWLLADVEQSNNKYYELNETQRNIQNEIQDNLEKLIMKGHKPEFIEQIIKRRDKINSRIIENASPQKKQKNLYSSN